MADSADIGEIYKKLKKCEMYLGSAERKYGYRRGQQIMTSLRVFLGWALEEVSERYRQEKGREE